LRDLGFITIDEPAKKLINQGMIQGVSLFAHVIEYAVDGNTRKELLVPPPFADHGFKSRLIRIPIDSARFEEGKFYIFKEDFILLKNSNNQFENIAFCTTENLHHLGITDVDATERICLKEEVEKMSKSKWNVVNPDDIIEKYGADCLRMYEMFLGPLEQSKPWNTNGITGVYNFIRKLWKLYHLNGVFEVTSEEPTKAELKTLHKTIRKVQEDIEKFSFNTSVSSFMICVNELMELKCNKRAVLEPLAIILSPYAPHIAEELWQLMGHDSSITGAEFPQWNESYLVENEFEYPISINGKTRFKINLPLHLSKEEIEKQVLEAPELQKYANGQNPKKLIVVPGRIVNVVL
jgi:leucyl-tRNA synthetase